MESEVKQWLQSALKSEKLKDFSVKIVGNSEKGDGYLGDIVFVDVSGVTEDETKKDYNLVLKCSKKSEALRTQNPIKEIFLNEICIYENIVPAFRQFQKEKGIEDYFDSVPAYYGNFVGDSMEVIVLENLRKSGYDLWDRNKPLTRDHINLVTSKYAQFHAISVAMNDQKPEEFKSLRDPIENGVKYTEEDINDSVKMFEACIEDVYNLVQNDFEEDVLLKWRNLKEYVSIMFDESNAQVGVKVITHGDCWNNNFMYLCEHDFPKKVAILDWQLSRFDSPIFDLSYFLFACISEEDLKDMDAILQHYYISFADHLEKLGSQAWKIYPFEDFLNDWNMYCSLGVMLATLTLKLSTTDKDEAVDLAEAADQGRSVASAFLYESKNKEAFKNRIRPIVKYYTSLDDLI